VEAAEGGTYDVEGLSDFWGLSLSNFGRSNCQFEISHDGGGRAPAARAGLTYITSDLVLFSRFYVALSRPSEREAARGPAVCVCVRGWCPGVLTPVCGLYVSPCVRASSADSSVHRSRLPDTRTGQRPGYVDLRVFGATGHGNVEASHTEVQGAVFERSSTIPT